MSLISSAIGALTAGKAAKAQKRAADAARASIENQFRETSGMLAPYREAGTNALSMLRDSMGMGGDEGYGRVTDAFRSDPGYEFAVNEGLRATSANAAARGIHNSGGTLKALQTRGQGMADQQYGNFLSRLRGMADQGYGATVATGNFGAGQAAGQAEQWMNRGNANANSIMAPYQGYRQFMGDVMSVGGILAGGGAFGPGGMFGKTSSQYGTAQSLFDGGRF